MKRSRKAISIILTLVMLMSMLVPAGAFAATKNTTNSVPTVGTDFKGLISSLTIKEDGAGNNDFTAGRTFIVTLPDSVKFAVYNGTTWESVTDANVTNALGTFTDPSGATVSWVTPGLAAGTLTATFSNERSLSITFNGTTNTASAENLMINFYGIVDNASGDLKVNINPLDSGVTGGDVVIGRSASGNLEATALDVKTIGQGAAEAAGIIRLTETTPGAFNNGDEVKLKLPSGFKWANTTVVSALAGMSGVNFTYGPGTYFVSADGRELIVKVATTGTTASTTRGIIEIKPVINVMSDAELGDVTVDISGDDVTTTELLIAKYADYGVSVTAKEVKEVLAGRFEADLGTIVVEENVDNTIIGGRKLTLELPANAKFEQAPSIEWVSGGGTILLNTSAIVTDNNHKYEMNIDPSRSAKARKFEIKLKKINLQSDEPGDIEVKLYGSAIGEEKKVVVAKSIAPVTVTTEAKDIKLGLADQAVGDIIIKEAKAGAIKDKNFTAYNGKKTTESISQGSITLDIASFYQGSVKFAKTPKVEVIEGNIELDTVIKSDRLVTINIKSDSSKPSTIKVSGIYLTVDRTVPVGGIKVSVGGTSVDQTNVGSDAAKSNKGWDTGTVADVVPAVVVNAAPAAGSATFNIGSNVYTVDGAAKVMDAAPYIKEGRTYVPVRFLAMSLGVTEENIKYENGVVTLKKGDVTLKMTIGDKNLDANGTISAMDVAPEVVNGRTMLPARFVAEGFGAMVGYANGQVVISY